jgi:hypothetical protein
MISVLLSAAAPLAVSVAADVAADVPDPGAVRSAEGPNKSAQTFLEWDAPEGCPDRAAVYQRSLDAVGYPPERGRFDRVRAVVAGKPGAWVLTLELAEGEKRSTRSIEAAACTELAGAAAVAIALVLGGEGRQWDAAPSMNPSVPLAGTDSGVPLHTAPSNESPEPRSRQAMFALEAIFDGGSLAAASFGAGIDAASRGARSKSGLAPCGCRPCASG